MEDMDMEDTANTLEQIFQGNDSISIIWKVIEESLEDFNLSESQNISFNTEETKQFDQDQYEEDFDSLKYVVEGLLMFTIGCIGICFNLISFVVYLRQKCHKTFHRLLFLLVIIDTLHLVSSLLSFSVPRLSHTFLTNTYLHTLPYTLPLAQTTLVMSMYMTISVSVERYISVIHPLLSIRLHSRYSCSALALPSIIFSIVFTLPMYFVVETETKCLQTSDNFEISQIFENESMFGNSDWATLSERSTETLARPSTQLVWAQWRHSQAFVTVYVMWLHLIFIIIIPFSILFWLNTSIYRKLSEQAVLLRRTGQKQLRKRETRLGRVSLAIVAVYLLCHTPKVILTLCETIFQDAKILPALFEISHLLLVINCSINFPIYYLATKGGTCSRRDTQNQFEMNQIQRTRSSAPIENNVMI